MSHVLLTYDVSDKNPEVKDKLKKLGYQDRLVRPSDACNLPNSTMWRPNHSPAGALLDIKLVADGLRVKLERAVAVPFDEQGWSGIKGDPHGTLEEFFSMKR